ncbi:ankyrin repeat-containing protein ITN1-like [Benincasa hispida]|uniref:ankyrin repeat-containing protein ITN1-like n=1 Tax=Benincasa hispida TaxID=102211 RepID=UPI00190091FD|nr:ankyrin repeat-containing protein ITN1-like [Benincasa hispida]
MAESRRKRLDEAAIEGNVTTLLELLQQDPMLLARLNLNDFNETPLHVAALHGHVTFVDEILKRRPQLAKDSDSRHCSALHCAAAEGFLDIVKILVRVDPDMCSICNEDGRNPIHLAAIKGRVDVLAELVRVRPTAARTAVDDGGTVLHLCVKYKQLEALEMLIETMAVKDGDFINTQDDYGFTILHLAVSNKQLQIVQYLINHTGIEVNAKTSNGLTALDILTQSHRELKDMDIAEALIAANAVRTTNKQPSSPSSRVRKNKKTGLRWAFSALFHNGDWWFKNETSGWLMKQESLMVVASLIATMAFQAGMNPPGGIWQDDNASGNPRQTAGTSVMAGKDKATYNKYLLSNTVGFMTSFIAIVMILIGLPQKRICMRVLIMTMCAAVCSMAFTYGYSIRFFTPLPQPATSNSNSLAPSPQLAGGSISGTPRLKSDSVISLISFIVAAVVTSSMVLFLVGKLFYVHSRQNKSTENPDTPPL